MRSIKLITFGVFLFLMFFNNLSYSQVPEELFNLKGLWAMQTDKGHLYERWVIDNNGLLSGAGFEIDTVNGDTTFIEFLNINNTQDSGISYSVIVMSDTGGGRINFKLSKIDYKIFTFTNPNHDYPQSIVYDLTEPDILYAKIEGIEKGVFRTYYFRFEKTKE